MCSSRKYPCSPHGRFFVLHPPPLLPLENFSLASYFASKILALKTPLPVGISDDLQWGGYEFFPELHNATMYVDLHDSSKLLEKGVTNTYSFVAKVI